MNQKSENAMPNSFQQLLEEYRSMGIHFLKLVTKKKEYLLILNDSYYLTYWDDSEDVVYSIVIHPKQGVDKAPIEHCDMNHRNLDEWYKEVRQSFEAREDKDSYEPPHRRNIRISYVNEDEKVPLKDFLAVIPRTEYRTFGNFILFLEVGTGLRKTENSYYPDEKSHPFINLWMHRKEMRRLRYELEHPTQMVAIHTDDIREIYPAVYGARFAFDDGDVKVLRDVLIK